MAPDARRLEELGLTDEFESLSALRDGDGGVGAVVSFVGTVRDVHHGTPVQGMVLEHFPGMTERALAAMDAADITKPTVKPVPYTGGQFVAIPEFQAIGTAVGQQFSAAVAGQVKPDQALTSAQQLTEREMTKAGYIK